ncbi:MAG: ATP-binding SpoIIE family protein phosphatase [Pontibacterium sp.]
MKILVVEDSTIERLVLSRILETLGYSVTLATNGLEGLEQLREEQIRLVITDNHMPLMTGQELCRTVRADTSYGEPYIIMLTSGEGDDDLVKGMESGADDFLRKPCAAEELRVRIAAGCRLIEMREELENKNRSLQTALLQVKEKQRLLDQDIAVAEQLVNEFMPVDEWLSPDLDVAVDYEMAQGIGGDSFGFQSLAPEKHFFYQVDVMGHGVASALLSFTLTNTIRQMLNHYATQTRNLPPLHQLARRLNELFPSEKFSGLYFTLFLGLLDEDQSRLSYCVAGHPPPIVITPGGDKMPVPKGSFPVGLFDFVDFETRSLAFEPGTLMLVSSDGLFDLIRPEDSRQGREDIETLMLKFRSMNATQIRDQIRSLAAEHKEGPPPDDISLIIIKRQGDGKVAESSDSIFRISLNPHPDDLAQAMDKIRSNLQVRQVHDMTLMRLTTSLSELINNIIEHGHWPQGQDKSPVELEVSFQNHDIVVSLVDYTERVPDLCPPRPLTLDNESGRGIHIMISWTDQIDYKRVNDYNRWTLSFRNNN